MSSNVQSGLSTFGGQAEKTVKFWLSAPTGENKKCIKILHILYVTAPKSVSIISTRADNFDFMLTPRFVVLPNVSVPLALRLCGTGTEFPRGCGRGRVDSAPGFLPVPAER
jgi:hypothetical protein